MFVIEISTKSQAPASAEAASPRQAKQQTNSNVPNSKSQTKSFWSFGYWNLRFIWDLDFGIWDF
jgi:hypothetical protein